LDTEFLDTEFLDTEFIDQKSRAAMCGFFMRYSQTNPDTKSCNTVFQQRCLFVCNSVAMRHNVADI